MEECSVVDWVLLTCRVVRSVRRHTVVFSHGVVKRRRASKRSFTPKSVIEPRL
jgi:hypothetical protein